MAPLDAGRIFADGGRPVHVGRRGEVCQSVSSTMDVALERLAADAPDGYAVVAEHQSAGRGRTGSWECPAGAGVLMSVILNVGLPVADQRVVVIMGSVALAEAVQKLGVAARIKWPNDIVVVAPGSDDVLRMRKLAGVLVQRVARPDGTAAHILGVGVNVNQGPDELPRDVAVAATSMSIERGAPFDRNVVCRTILRELDAWYRLLAMGQTERILARWRTHSCLLHRRVRLLVDGRAMAGTVLGIRSTGELIIRDSSSRRHVLSAERVALLP